MSVWLILIGMGLVTFGIRLALILLIGRMPEPDGVLVLSPLDNVRIIAAGLAVFVAGRTKRILPTIVVGIISFWILQAVLG